MNLQRFLLSLLIGAVLGLALGYSIYMIGDRGAVPDFLYWVNRKNMFSGDHYYDAYFWALGGMVVAGAINLLRSKNSN
jgi:hypothetical protein